MEKELLNVGEVAAMCGVATRTVARWRDMGYCPPPLKMCKSVRWRKTDILEWINEGNGCDCRKTGWKPNPVVGCQCNHGGTGK